MATLPIYYFWKMHHEYTEEMRPQIEQWKEAMWEMTFFRIYGGEGYLNLLIYWSLEDGPRQMHRLFMEALHYPPVKEPHFFDSPKREWALKELWELQKRLIAVEEDLPSFIAVFQNFLRKRIPDHATYVQKESFISSVEDRCRHLAELRIKFAGKDKGYYWNE